MGQSSTENKSTIPDSLSSTKPSPASSAQFKSTIDVPALNPEEFMESPKVDYLGTFDQALASAKKHGVDEFG